MFRNRLQPNSGRIAALLSLCVLASIWSAFSQQPFAVSAYSVTAGTTGVSANEVGNPTTDQGTNASSESAATYTETLNDSYSQGAAPSLTFGLGTVTEIISETLVPIDGISYYTQTVKVREHGSNSEKTITAGSQYQPLAAAQRLKKGMTVILSYTTSSGETTTAISDIYRIPQLVALLLFFAMAVLLVARRRGLMAFLGMVVSVAVLVGYVVPNVLRGSDPLFLSFGGATIIAAATLYLQYGWKKRTHIAFGSILASLVVVGLISKITSVTASLVGFGNEEASFLSLSLSNPINLQGLLLGGILLGALGVLDDVVVSQVSVVAQLKAVNDKLTFPQLYARALEVGKDHVASLVNTLVLAYAGANLPLFLLFALTPNTPLWVVLNNQTIAEEIVRTAAGSIGLVLAVPLTTFIAASTLTKKDVIGEAHEHHH